MTTALSGIKPTGTLHLGNYLGMIRPALALAARSERSFYFIADYHALNTMRDPLGLRDLTLDVEGGLTLSALLTYRWGWASALYLGLEDDRPGQQQLFFKLQVARP